MSDRLLEDWRTHALQLENEVNQVVVGQDNAVRLITTAIFARGHVLLEGDVGVGKTTLLRAVTRGIGGGYQRIEGTIDLMPNDLVYHTYLGDDGRPHVSPGPLLSHGTDLAVFFFNEINRARPQVHSLLLRVMAERTLSAFNREHTFPHMLVFADRNQVEKEETFEIPSAARDRFMMEIPIVVPSSADIMESLIFDTRYHDVDSLVDQVSPGILQFDELNQIAALIQNSVQATPALRKYALDLWLATRDPAQFGIQIEGVDIRRLVIAGASPRGIAMMMRAARVNAWLNGREAVLPEDIHAVFQETIAHRLVFNPIYEMRRTALARELLDQIVHVVSVA
ncbi:MoxR-like ATPase [Methylobacillus rhizosphaerae]|uniref:MoxR-like ATPase n=1 Tax=Methylobacillus rhizosphaerae TaxID=551994 RepID=A0A239AP61_9PROT|nr:MoxR family ATPase [Methylobacillus rhizosphaerae]SNR97437.1 MoxR-like ATPase [Methylobacillus rhizosphaerae]